jgi:hypothetical protein
MNGIAKCNVTYKDDKITINGLASPVEIDCSSDINITKLVEELVVALESNSRIESEFNGFDDANNKKHGIIKNAISGAFEAFNEIYAPIPQTEE